MAFLAGTGVRIDEARRVRWEDFDSGRVYVRGTKTETSNRRLNLLEPVSEKVEAELRSILYHSCMIPVDLDLTCALRARQVGITYGLKTWDAVHLASALQSGAEVFFTLDGDDFPLGRELEGVWVDRPYLPGEDDLFTGGA